MTQVGSITANGLGRFLASCPRRDCEIQAAADSPSGPCSLLPQFEYLLDEGRAHYLTSEA